MSETADPEPSNERSPTVIPPSHQDSSDQQEVFPAAFLQIERQRIDSYNRRTEIASQAVAASNEADKRQFDFQMAKLSSDDGAAKRRDSLARMAVISLGLGGFVVVGLFLVMAFFGSPMQSAIALKILKALAVGGGGYGIINGIVSLLRRLMQPK